MSRITNQPLYSFVDYPERGANSLEFFTTADGDWERSNMMLPGCMPRGFEFIVQGVEVVVLAPEWNVTNEVLHSGALQMFVMNRRVMVGSPLKLFTKWWETGPRFEGVYGVEDIRLHAQCSFSVQAKWRVPVPMACAVKIGVRLLGCMSETEW